MNKITPQLFEIYVRQLRIGNNLKRRITTAPLVVIDNAGWNVRELLPIPTKDGKAGILFVEVHGEMYGVPYEISPLRDAATGRSKPIICDFCKTWQAGARAGYITFQVKRGTSNVIGFLCCADLQCSLHVRDLTSASKVSRSQLREDITTDRRIERLRHTLEAVVGRLALSPLACD